MESLAPLVSLFAIVCSFYHLYKEITTEGQQQKTYHSLNFWGFIIISYLIK